MKHDTELLEIAMSALGLVLIAILFFAIMAQ